MAYYPRMPEFGMYDFTYHWADTDRLDGHHK